MRARYYDPAVGRWISEDPIGVGGGLNLYVYGGSDPVNIVDPWGLGPCLVYTGSPTHEPCILPGIGTEPQAGGTDGNTTLHNWRTNLFFMSIAFSGTGLASIGGYAGSSDPGSAYEDSSCKDAIASAAWGLALNLTGIAAARRAASAAKELASLAKEIPLHSIATGSVAFRPTSVPSGTARLVLGGAAAGAELLEGAANSGQIATGLSTLASGRGAANLAVAVVGALPIPGANLVSAAIDLVGSGIDIIRECK